MALEFDKDYFSKLKYDGFKQLVSLENFFIYFSRKQVVNPKGWPNWIKVITHFSHLALVFSNSVNFYIYLGIHWRTIFNKLI